MFQQIILVGNLGRDPELRYTPQGIAVVNFSLATNESWTDQDGDRQDRTTWWRVTCWRGLAESCAKYLAKGRQVMVIGRMNPDPETGGPRLWQGNDGATRASYEITAQTVRFLGGRPEVDEQRDEVEEIEIPF